MPGPLQPLAAATTIKTAILIETKLARYGDHANPLNERLLLVASPASQTAETGRVPLGGFLTSNRISSLEAASGASLPIADDAGWKGDWRLLTAKPPIQVRSVSSSRVRWRERRSSPRRSCC